MDGERHDVVGRLGGQAVHREVDQVVRGPVAVGVEERHEAIGAGVEVAAASLDQAVGVEEERRARVEVAVLLVIPVGLIGAIAFVTLRGLTNDVYLQIGLLTTMGLAAKNAILMIEFAEQAEKQGKRVIDAALEAARIRLRPILMTSFAFIFGVLPLAISTGAGANARIAIGTAVIGGMLTATILAIFYIPLFFVLVRRGVRDGIAKLRGRPTGFQGGGPKDGDGGRNGDDPQPLLPAPPDRPLLPEPS